LRPALAIVLAALLLTAISAAPASASALSRGDRDALQRYAADTWHSFDLLVDTRTGLPDDNVTADGTRSGYTSPTNIGAYLWSTLGAREVGLIGRREATARMARTLATLARLERGPGGQFFNWYDPATGARLTTWPADGSPLVPFLSAVDNGWLAAGLTMVRNGVPEQRAKAHALVAAMDFGFYYDPAVGQLRGGGVDRAAARLQRCPGRGVDDVQPLRRPELRAAHGQLPRDRRRPGPARALLPPQPHLLAPVRRGRLPGDAAHRRNAHPSGR
jgi:hypothetical protein